ncbi:MAG TPA: 2,3-bisphosphoglycerate-independent phosphoglycerate mutase, partial [Anaerolineales bacterium]|nr:2,3-bisphosphoglycerate-independent phosphoglycerate mutase [Anaerolineales bacterium]
MSSAIEKRVMLIILDGWGHSPDPAVSAIDQAHTPVMDGLYEKYPNAELTTHGLAVGLPAGQMGNSEVGHLNIGAGRVVDQELVRIAKAIQSRALHQNPTLLDAIQDANRRNARIHLMGLLSDGGVHSHMHHLKALCDILSENARVPVFIHAFTDGRDVGPHTGLGFVREINEYVALRHIRLASVVGRYYAMDRDKRWERTKIAYDALVHGTGTPTMDLISAVETSYAAGVTDEFILPIIQTGADGHPVGVIQAGDLIIFFNFRTDRPRQLISVLSQQAYPD